MAQLNWFYEESGKDLSAAELMNEALLKLTILSFDELVKQSGMGESLAAVRPYRKWAYQWGVSQLKEKLNLQDNGPEAMALLHRYAGIGLVSLDKMDQEIKEKGAVTWARDCIFSRTSPELCMTISHYYTEVVAELINPEYEAVWTHHQSSGDPYCRCVWKKKSDPISVLDDMGETLRVLPRLEVTKEEILATSIWAFGSIVYSYVCAFRDLHGDEETKKVIGAVAIRIGQEMGEKLAEQNSKLKGSLVSVGGLVRAMQNAMGQRDNFMVISEVEVNNEITDCSQSGYGNFPCTMVIEPLFSGMVAAINPDFEFAYEKIIPMGDDICRWTIRKRSVVR